MRQHDCWEQVGLNFCFVIGLTASQLAEANKFTFFGPRLEPPHSGLSSCVVVGWRSKWPSTQLLVLFCSNAALLTPAGTWAHGGHGSLPGLATRERADLRTNTPWTGCSIDGFAQCSESKSYTRVLRTFCVQSSQLVVIVIVANSLSLLHQQQQQERQQHQEVRGPRLT